MFVDVEVCWAPFLDLGVIGAIDVMGAISSNRTLEYAEEFSHIDVVVAVLTFYLKLLMMLISFLL